MLAEGVFGLSVVEIAVILAGAGYVVSLIKDWRPVRTLRSDNHELRKQLGEAERKIAGLEAEVRSLQKATDLTVLQDEHRKIADVLERVVAKLDSLDRAVHANTASIEVLARGSLLKKHLTDMEGGGSA